MTMYERDIIKDAFNFVYILHIMYLKIKHFNSGIIINAVIRNKSLKQDKNEYS